MLAFELQGQGFQFHRIGLHAVLDIARGKGEGFRPPAQVSAFRPHRTKSTDEQDKKIPNLLLRRGQFLLVIILSI